MSTLNSSTTASLVTRILHLPITSDAEAFVTVARATDRVVVRLTEPGPEQRAQLCRFVVRGIESELGRLGAAPRGYGDDDAIESILGDQLYRARLLGCFGLAVSFASLAGIADAQGQLGEADSRTLRRLVALAESEPLQLHLPRPCAELHVLGGPEPLASWLPPELAPGAVASIEYDLHADSAPPPAVELAFASSGPTLVPPEIDAFVEAAPGAAWPEPAPTPGGLSPDAGESNLAAAALEQPETTDWEAAAWQTQEWDCHEWDAAEPEGTERDDLERDSLEPDGLQPNVVEARAADPDSETSETLHLDAPASGYQDAPASGEYEPSVDLEALEDALVEPASETLADADPYADETPLPPSAAAPLLADQSLEPELPDAGLPSSAPEALDDAAAVAAVDPERARRCIAWGTQLQGMSGPKAHGSVEKAFITAYLPLCREIASGGVPAEAQAAADRWAEGFAQSYASAFRQLHTRTRRPLMVRDVVDLGLRWMGQHPARQCQLLLVSAMRFDLGQRLNEEIERRFRGAAMCAEQSILWTALPSNPEAQLLGFSDTRRNPRPMEPVRTVHEAAPIQPFLVGNRELSRLSLVLDDLPRAGEVENVRLERLAVRLADSIVPWMQRQPPDTLIVIFGDHGFHWESTPAGTSAAQRGGALPAQVLVPASAWLTRPPRAFAGVAPGLH